MITTKTVKEMLRGGAYAWPGGYPMFFITSDGAALSFAAVRANWCLVCAAMRGHLNDGWRVIAAEVNWEDPDLYCADSNERIPSAYAEA